MSTTIEGPDGRPRCRWCAAAPEFLAYHDAEWGFPVDDDRRLFEKLSLEGFQSGLSWRTILAKRENFRAAFRGFDFDRIARFTARDVGRLLADDGIVRHRGKIEAVVNNARRARELVEREGSLAAFLWRYEPDPARLAAPQTASTSAESVALSKDLKKLGWKFVGPTTVHAFMQAMGPEQYAMRLTPLRCAQASRSARRGPQGDAGASAKGRNDAGGRLRATLRAGAFCAGGASRGLPVASATRRAALLSPAQNARGAGGSISSYTALINDHAAGCAIRPGVERARKNFKRPGR